MPVGVKTCLLFLTSLLAAAGLSACGARAEPQGELEQPYPVTVQGVGEQPEHPLLRKAAREAAHGFRMGPGFLGPLRCGPLGTEQQRADEFIPILRGVEKRQLGVVSIGIGPHW